MNNPVCATLVVPDVPWAAEIIATIESSKQWKVEVANEMIQNERGEQCASHRIYLTRRMK